MRVVVDTNTLASGALKKSGSPVTAVVDAWRAGVFTLVVSPDILDELSRTLAKPYFVAHLTPDDIAAFLGLLHTIPERVTIAGVLAGIATHPEDDRILEAATTAHADYLVTGDSKLQDLKKYQGVTIVSPRQFTTAVLRPRTGAAEGSPPNDQIDQAVALMEQAASTANLSERAAETLAEEAVAAGRTATRIDTEGGDRP